MPPLPSLMFTLVNYLLSIYCQFIIFCVHFVSSAPACFLWLCVVCSFFITLIGPGEVKADLANIDLKLQENFLSTLFLLNTYSCRNVFQIFLNYWHYLKKLFFDLHFDVVSSEVHLRRHPATPPPFLLVLLLLETSRGWEMSRREVVCSPMWHQSGLPSVSGPRLWRVLGVVGSQSGTLSCSI